MATTIKIEVMYNEAPKAGALGASAFRRKRVSLDAAHTLDRDNIWYIILSDDASSFVHASNARRTVDSVLVDRVTSVWWDDSDSGVAFLIRRGGEVCLQSWEDRSWNWFSEENPFGVDTPSAGIDALFPKDALIFHLVRPSVSRAHSDLAKTIFDSEMY